MISAVDLRKGTVFIYRDAPFEVIDFQHSLRGRGRGKMWIKMRNLKTGNVLEETFPSEESFAEPDIEVREMQYLYEQADGFEFMDNITFEQFAFVKDSIGAAKWFLKEGMSYKLTLFEGLPLSVDLPASMVLRITETEPAVRGDTVSNVTKRAVLETGLEIKVPLFVEEGDSVKVDTRTLSYLSRA